MFICTKKCCLCFAGIRICCGISLTKAQCLSLLRYFHFYVASLLFHSLTPPALSPHSESV